MDAVPGLPSCTRNSSALSGEAFNACRTACVPYTQSVAPPFASRPAGMAALPPVFVAWNVWKSEIDFFVVHVNAHDLY
ncbi:MAG: hypothetical protein ACREUU_20195, partial [Gammaproteobacteria bacterium]